MKTLLTCIITTQCPTELFCSDLVCRWPEHSEKTGPLLKYFLDIMKSFKHMGLKSSGGTVDRYSEHIWALHVDSTLTNILPYLLYIFFWSVQFECNL